MICCERRHKDDFEDDDKNAQKHTTHQRWRKKQYTNERTPNGEEKKDVSCRSTKLLLLVLELSLFKRGAETTKCVFKRSTRFIALFVLLFDMMMMMMQSDGTTTTPIKMAASETFFCFFFSCKIFSSKSTTTKKHTNKQKREREIWHWTHINNI